MRTAINSPVSFALVRLSFQKTWNGVDADAFLKMILLISGDPDERALDESLGS
jgi:hypothetical protein